MNIRVELTNRCADLEKNVAVMRDSIEESVSRIQKIKAILASMTPETEETVATLVSLGILEEERPF